MRYITALSIILLPAFVIAQIAKLDSCNIRLSFTAQKVPVVDCGYGRLPHRECFARAVSLSTLIPATIAPVTGSDPACYYNLLSDSTPSLDDIIKISTVCEIIGGKLYASSPEINGTCTSTV